MQQKDIYILIISTVIVFAAFFAGVILFIIQSRKNLKSYKVEKELITVQHQQQLLTTQLRTQTQTMHFIGREIHDNVGQRLTLASLYAKQLLNSSNAAAEKINTIGNIIDESLADLRQLSKSLTNPALADAALTQLLNDEAVKINSLGSCLVSISDNTRNIQLQPAQKNILYRLLQEFIQNSLKHSGCRKINITLQQNNDKLNITAEDDGSGFDTLKESSGQGLANMKRRAEELHARFSLQSQPDSGTKIIIEIPLNQQHEI